MKNKTLHLVFAIIFFAVLNLSAQTSFIQTCDTLNKHNGWTAIDNSLLNNKPNALAFETQVWNPGGTGGVYNNHATGVWYNTYIEFNKWHWAIFNQDYLNILNGASFNVLVPSETDDVFVHTANAENITENWTVIDHPSLNNNPDAIIVVTQNWNPNNSSIGRYNNQSIGVWYYSAIGKWTVFNQSKDTMPKNAAFNILVPGSNYTSFIQTAALSNIANNYSFIDNEELNNHPNAEIFVTQRWEGIRNNNNIGVWYDNESNKWAIFNQNADSLMHENAKFNVVFIKEAPNAVNETIAQGGKAGEFSIFPNPVQSIAEIKFYLIESQNLKFELYATDGRLIKTMATNNFNSGENILFLDFSFLSPGSYLLVMQGTTVSNSNKLIVIE